MQCWSTREPFKKVLLADAEVRQHLDEADLDRAFDMDDTLARVGKIFARVLGDSYRELDAAEVPETKGG